jgi:uncharacterized protein (UPF0332 family)
VTEGGRREAAAEELARANEELAGAEHLLRVGLARIALGRAYFAAFHACRAVLYSEGLEPRSHHGALHLFNLHLVKTGRFETKTSRVLARLQKFREEADYGESFPVDDAGAREELEAARAFVDRVAAELGPPTT